MRWLIAVMLCALVSVLAEAQDAKRPVPQQGSEPNYGTKPSPPSTGPGGQELRPGSPDGDAPSASAGQLATKSVERRVLGLPVNAALLIGAVILALLALGGFLLPNARRRRQARGGGSY